MAALLRGLPAASLLPLCG